MGARDVAEQGTWWLQVCGEDGMPAGGPVKVTPGSEAQIMAELQDLGLPWEETYLSVRDITEGTRP